MDDWETLIKDIQPLKEKKAAVFSTKKIKLREKTQEEFISTTPPNGVDGSTMKKFNREKFNIEATLDLHGFNHDQAFNEVINFIKKAYLKQNRCILIITGKGEVLRKELPRWLENQEIKNLILSVKQPSQSLGGSGAFMLLIKRIRNT
ncbi:MAG: Smr/MutS family protein [Alphaproteobacteria bacterium]